MKTEIIICDVCGCERGHLGDDMKGMPVQVAVTPPFMSGLANQMDICLSCRDRIWNAAKAEVEAIRKQEWGEGETEGERYKRQKERVHKMKRD